jgi:hypothetical protein
MSDELTTKDEGVGTWTVKEVVAHLIICEQTNWIVRLRTILSDTESKEFLPMDMNAHFQIACEHSIEYLIYQFKQLRGRSLAEIRSLHLDEADLFKTAVHPVLGVVDLKQLISTWVAHDLTHMSQIARVMAKQYKDDIGPFIKYLNRLNQP